VKIDDHRKPPVPSSAKLAYLKKAFVMPARKSSAAKALLGTLRRERDVPDSAAAAGEPAMPPGMSRRAMKHWRLICQALSDLGLLRSTDAATISTAAMLLCDRDDLRSMIEREGRVYVAKGTNGTELRRPHPAHAILDSVERRLLASLLQLGLSPRARLSLHTTSARANDHVGPAPGAPSTDYF
jgi:P27 family predicted phage terminase small subunit